MYSCEQLESPRVVRLLSVAITYLQLESASIDYCRGLTVAVTYFQLESVSIDYCRGLNCFGRSGK